MDREIWFTRESALKRDHVTDVHPHVRLQIVPIADRRALTYRSKVEFDTSVTLGITLSLRPGR